MRASIRGCVTRCGHVDVTYDKRGTPIMKPMCAAGPLGGCRRRSIRARALGGRIGRAVTLVLASTLALARVAGAAADSTSVAAPAEPFAFADFSWVPGNAGASERPLAFGAFTGEFRLDDVYHYSFSNPQDGTISGSSEAFRHGEFQITQLGIGGDLLYKDVMGRLMTQFGMYSTATPRNDASPGRGQWRLDDAYRYLSEAYGGYHFHALHGVNVQAGVFMSFIGLWSYYNADNWTYQPSYVSSNTPWFFNGMRVQIFPSDKLKIEPWLINGWQSYGRINDAPGGGGQILWRPNGSVSVVGNQYIGKDAYNNVSRLRLHTDDSFMTKYMDHPGPGLDKAAFSLTVDAGCESGGGVTPSSQYFLGFMAYNRFWFARDRYGLTIGGGAITNPGRYLVLMPPINGATALSGTPYFTENPGDPFKAWDMQIAGDLSPSPFVTFRLEYNHRDASVPYFAGRGGVTPPGGNQGAPGSIVPNWSPDLVKTENRLSLAMLVKV
jgi:Putative beta-barrel porin-2, OmpL-like. bbp2